MNPIDIKAQKFVLNFWDTIDQFIAHGYYASIRDFAK